MQTSVQLDDELLEAARRYAPANVKVEELLRLALKCYIHIGAGKALAALGGSAPDMQDVPRRRSEPADDEGD
jgi:hypothetical protein